MYLKDNGIIGADLEGLGEGLKGVPKSLRSLKLSL